MPLAGILLAAGFSTRFGRDKLLVELSGEPIGVTAYRHLAAAVPDSLAVVRSDDHALAAALERAGARVIACPNAESGMGASFAYGVHATPDASGWVIALADMPWTRAETIARVAHAIEQGASIAAPFYRGVRGHPVGFDKSWGPTLAGLTGDEGAKHVLAGNRALIMPIAVDDEGVLLDIDSPADLPQN